ncbi:MAG: M6 family metalloprotease domain-containing protein, partial [Candidatus Marinimicrobia bacterium]|nr:M6 family metalloprotease domain-containing protein [Candidatus Neomarinimicrobiota bacterium]
MNLPYYSKLLVPVFLLNLVLSVSTPPFIYTISQPNDAEIPVKMSGHEYYNWLETADGYVIEKDPSDLFWYYSDLDAGGNFVSSGIPVKYPAPIHLNIPPGLREVFPKARELSHYHYGESHSRNSVLLRGSTTLFRPLVFLIDFSNLPADLNSITPHYSQEQFQSLLFDTNLNPATAGLPSDYERSMRDYYYEVSGGKMEIHGEVIDWTTLSNSYSYYVDNAQGTGAGSHGILQSSAAVLVEAALANDAKVDYSEFDGNEDGVVDAVILVVRGWSDGSDTHFWPHMSLLHGGINGIASIAPGAPVDSDGYLSLDNTAIKEYILVTEQYYQNNQGGAERGWIHPIGTLCHELGHVLGLPDLYDTTPASTEGIGEWGLMGSGNWNMQHSPAYPSAWSRYRLGFIEPQFLEMKTSLALSLAPTDNHTAYLLPMDSWNPNEYLLLENRQAWGTDLFLKGTGLLVWHIDETLTDMYPAMNQVNANPEVYGVQLLQADGLNELAHNNGYADSGDPFPGSTGNTYISDLSTPSAMNYAYDKNGDNEMNEGGGSGIIISDILAGNDHHLSLTITNPNTMSHSFAYDEGNYEGRAYNDNLNFLQWAGIRFQPQDTLVATAVETVFPPSHTGWGVTEINVNLWKGWENYTPQTL